MFTQAELQPYLDAGLLTVRPHPEHQYICIYNYTPLTQYEQRWDVVTRQCRGLVLHTLTGEVLARPFPKFHNYEEHVARQNPLPQETPIITEKVDGALGILVWVHGKPWIATRGSFTSPQAEWATRWFRAQWDYFTGVERAYLKESTVTHLFEIVASVSRVVVRYPFQGLVHLAAIEKETGRDRWPLSRLDGIRQPRIIAPTDYATLKSMDADNAEGFVLYFPQAGLRVKIKFDRYVQLHRLVTGLSAHALWELLRDGVEMTTVLAQAPDEVFQWANARVETLIHDRQRIETTVQTLYRSIKASLTPTWGKDAGARRKAFALAIQQYPEYAALLFQWHNFQELLLKAIEPQGSERLWENTEEV